MQNLVDISPTVCTHVGGPKIWETLAPTLLVREWLTPRNTLLPHVIVPIFVALGQTFWAQVEGPRNFGDIGPRPGDLRMATPLETHPYANVLPYIFDRFTSNR